MLIPAVELLHLCPLDVTPVAWSFMSPKDRQALVSLLRQVSPKIMIEIGVNRGGTAHYILGHVGSIVKYIGIDVLPGYRVSMPQQEHELPGDKVGCLIKGDPRFELVVKSRGSLDLSISDLGLCDAVLIDGDHGREAVTNDTPIG